MKERFWLKPLAVLLGILSWFYVNILSTTPIIRDYKVKITYLNKDDSKNYKVIPEDPEVKIKVRGPRGVFIRTKVEDNTFASVDLINCHGGKLTLPVNVIFPADSNLQLVSKEPAQLVINAIKMATKKIDVKVNVVGTMPDGYLSKEPSVSPSFLSVTAPEDIIDTIKECRIDLYLDDIRRSISEFRQTHIVYSDGTIESDLIGKLITIDNNNVKLDLAVKEGYPEKEISLKTDIINKPPEGKKLNSYLLTPEKIKITGSSRIIDNIEELSIEPIDLQNVHKTSNLKVKIKLPKGVRIVGDENKISLNIDYTDVLITRTINNLPLEVTHDEEQLVEFDISTYTVELEGFVDDINSIKQDEMKNIICVKGLSSGTHQIPLEIPYGFTQRVKVKSMIPSSIPITIRLLEKVDNIQTEKVEDNSINDKISSDSLNIQATISDKSSEIASDSIIINKEKNSTSISNYTDNLPQIIQSN